MDDEILVKTHASRQTDKRTDINTVTKVAGNIYTYYIYVVTSGYDPILEYKGLCILNICYKKIINDRVAFVSGIVCKTLKLCSLY